MRIFKPGLSKALFQFLIAIFECIYKMYEHLQKKVLKYTTMFLFSDDFHPNDS